MASSSSSKECVVDPEPKIKDLLKLQSKHVSKHVWNDNVDRLLTVRQAQLKLIFKREAW
jgi:hypothetical protein